MNPIYEEEKKHRSINFDTLYILLYRYIGAGERKTHPKIISTGERNLLLSTKEVPIHCANTVSNMEVDNSLIDASKRTIHSRTPFIYLYPLRVERKG